MVNKGKDMSGSLIYENRNGVIGERYICVAGTRAGVYAWYRPLSCADDGAYDVRLKVSDMIVIPQDAE